LGGQTLYAFFGDAPLALTMLLSLGLIAVSRRREATAPQPP
jgi:MYXO-CTERM domain-containing protein